MKLILKQKVRGMLGTEGTIVDIQQDKKGERHAVIEWNSAKRGTWQTTESMTRLQWLEKKGGLDIVGGGK